MRADLLTRFDADGFVVLPRFLDAGAVATLRREIELSAARHPGTNPLTLDTMRFVSNIYRDCEPLRALLASPRVVALVTALLGPDTWVRWDQAVWKGAGGPEFPWHQDNGYTELGVAHLQLWFALTPMTRDNGGLRLAPGGHGRLAPHRWVGNHRVMDDPETSIDIDATAGDVIAFSSFLPHATTPNTSGAERLAYVAEYLRVDDPDRTVEPPHFVASRGGRPFGQFVDLAD